MGGDKGMIRYQAKPQREYLFELLSATCDKVFTSCRKEQEIDEALNPVTDRFDFEGPMNGILSAFTLHPGKAWLVTAIDMPNITGDTFRYLKANRDPAKLATCFFDEKENAPEPLLTIFEPDAFPLLVKNLEAGNKSPRSFLRSSAVHLLKPDRPDLFFNVNYPHQREDWIKRD